ncbi:MAG: Mu-like prophage major head subunit gpT family protein [Aggregatilineales bacterium]
MPLRSTQFLEALIPGIYKFFDVGMSYRQPLAPQLYNVMSSNRAYEESIGMGAISADSWLNYEKSGEKSAVDFDQGYTTRMTHQEYPVKMIIERKLLDDDQYSNVIKSRAERLGISAQVRRETDAASIFNNAFTAEEWAGDGKALCANNHPRSPRKATSLSNISTTALTAANLSATRQAMMAVEDDAGNLLGMTPDTILVPPELEDAALEAVKSTQDPTSANNAINPQFGRYQIIPWHYLTDANNWFMIDSVWMRQSLHWYNRTPLEVILADSNTTEYVYEAYMRYSYGFIDWRWIHGHNVA